MGEPNTGQPAEAFDVDAWARDRARAKLGRVLLRQQRRRETPPPPTTPPPPLPTTDTPPPEAETLDPMQAARRLQRVTRRRIATRRSIEQARRAFARDYETRPPLRWEKPRPDDDSLAEVKRRLSMDDESTVQRLPSVRVAREAHGLLAARAELPVQHAATTASPSIALRSSVQCAARAAQLLMRFSTVNSTRCCADAFCGCAVQAGHCYAVC